jgi:hypothetical protein
MPLQAALLLIKQLAIIVAARWLLLLLSLQLTHPCSALCVATCILQACHGDGRDAARVAGGQRLAPCCQLPLLLLWLLCW